MWRAQGWSCAHRAAERTRERRRLCRRAEVTRKQHPLSLIPTRGLAGLATGFARAAAQFKPRGRGLRAGRGQARAACSNSGSGNSQPPPFHWNCPSWRLPGAFLHSHFRAGHHRIYPLFFLGGSPPRASLLHLPLSGGVSPPGSKKNLVRGYTFLAVGQGTFYQPPRGCRGYTHSLCTRLPRPQAVEGGVGSLGWGRSQSRCSSRWPGNRRRQLGAAGVPLLLC